jgi:hypothetical protein
MRQVLALVAAALLAAPAAALQGAGVKLEAKLPGVGHSSEVRVESALDLDIVSKELGGTETLRNSSRVRTEKFTQTVTEAPDAKTRVYKVACASSTLQRSGTNLPVQTDKTSLDGRTFWVTRGTNGSIKSETGEAAGADAASLGSWEDYGKLLPKTEVKSGDSWAVEDLSALFSAGNLKESRNDVKGRLDSVAGDNATLSFTGSVSGTTDEGYALTLTIVECRMVFDKAKGRPSSFDFKGSLEASKKVVQGYIPPGGHKPREETVGEAKITSKKFTVSVTYR